MRILEARDGFIKVESNEKLSLSSFLQISDTNKDYIAQVIQSKKLEDICIAYAKILFIYDGSLLNYDKSLPSRKASVYEFKFDLLNNSIENRDPIVVGSFIKDNIDIKIDKSCFDKKTLVSFDTKENNKILVTNLINQFLPSTNVLVIDMLGIFDSNKYIAGIDFKLPLNSESLEFMYEDCLNDATSDSKNLIKDIFQDLADYSKSVPFLPFSALKTIVDDMVDKSHVFKLLVLKNKLAKFDKEGYFAGSAKEAENLKNILNKKFAVIDLSKLDSTFQNRYLATIYSLLSKNNIKTQVFVEASNAINKKNIKNIITNPNISSVFVTHSRFKYLNEIKSLFDNYIIEPSFTNNEIFKVYSTFLNAMNKNTYLVVGDGTNYLPLISNLTETKLEMLPQNTCDDDINDSEPISNEDNNIIEEFEGFEKDEQTEAIEKKSEDLINKIAEEVSSTQENIVTSLFSEDNIEENIENEINEEILDKSIENNTSEIENILPLEPVLQDSDVENELTIDSLEESNPETSIEIDSNIVQIEPLDKENEELDSYEYHTHIDESLSIEVPENIIEIDNNTETENPSLEILEDSTTDNIEIEYPQENNIELGSETDSLLETLEYSEPSNETFLTQNETNEFLNEELEVQETLSEADLTVELDENNSDEIIIQEDLDKQIVEDVDKVFTTMKDESLSDSDLDFIDELNNDSSDDIIELSLSEGMEELTDFQEEDDEDSNPEFVETLEEVGNNIENNDNESKEILETRNAATPIVPVYDAEIPPEDMVISDEIEQGDSVIHVKYGNGIVEKRIKYGTKTLYSINFDNVGRRLLDPTLQEIKKA